MSFHRKFSGINHTRITNKQNRTESERKTAMAEHLAKRPVKVFKQTPNHYASNGKGVISLTPKADLFKSTKEYLGQQ